MKKYALACTLLLTTTMLSAQAGENMNSSDRGMLIATVVASVVISSPFILSYYLSDDRPAAQPKSRRSANDKLPDMEVKKVDEDENGNPRVYLEVPQHPEQNITLAWHKGEQNPAAAFREGSLIHLQPSPGASGWLMRDSNGAALAFVPLDSNAAENHSALF